MQKCIAMSTDINVINNILMVIFINGVSVVQAVTAQ